MKSCNEILNKNKIKILIIVRLGSRRLKNKAKLKIKNLSILEILIKRLLKKFKFKNIIICSNKKSKSNFFLKIKKKYKINLFYGDDKNIFKRIIDCEKKFHFNHFVRVTGDNPLTDANSICSITKKHLNKKNDYTFTENLPKGLRPEIFSLSALKKCYRIARDPLSSEYLTYFFKRKEFKYSSAKISKTFAKQSALSITIDIKNDFINLKNLIEKEGIFVRRKKIINFLKKNKIYRKDKKNPQFKLKTSDYDVRFI